MPELPLQTTAGIVREHLFSDAIFVSIHNVSRFQ